MKGKYEHSTSPSKTCRCWQNMLQRCNNSNNSRYEDYGGRGIKVCERWLGKNGFINFLEDMGECPEGMELDRKDNNGDYTPDNCRWVDRKTQRNNRRIQKNARFITVNGKTQTISQWSKETEINYQTLYTRVNKLKWTEEDAVNKSKRRKRR